MIQEMTPLGLLYVLNHLRPKDEAELHATIFLNDIETTCKVIMFLPGVRWEALTVNGLPAAVGGFSPVWPGLGAMWLWATDEWPQVAREVTRAAKRTILPAFDHAGVHRLEARPMAGNDEVVRWLKLLGFNLEAVIAQFGQGREDFLLFARTASHADRRH